MHTDINNNRQPNIWSTRGRHGWSLGAAALLLAGSLVGWTAADTFGTSAATVAPAPVAAGAAARTIGAGGDSYAPLVDRIVPAVVTIRSEKRVRTISQGAPDDPLFREFFGNRFPGPRA